MKYWLFIPALLFAYSGVAQEPLSWEYNGFFSYRSLEHTKQLPALSTFEQEDRKNGWDHRFAARLSSELVLFEHPDIRRMDGHAIVIEQVNITSSKGFALKINHPDLSPGEQLFFYNERGRILAVFDGSHADRPATSRIIGPHAGQSIYVEYNGPWWTDGPNSLAIPAIYPVYKEEFLSDRTALDIGFGAAKDCHNNVNCPKGSQWHDEKRGVVRIMIVMDQGLGWCSGSLVNNTSKDGTPYVLTAFHCIDGFNPEFNFWRFDFNYESASCQNPPSEPNYNSLVGCDKVSGRQATDFLLVRIDEEVPVDYNAYFNGWNREEFYLPQHSVLIHHPRADIKKISFDDQRASIFGSNIHWDNGVTTPPNSHYKAVLDDGIFEGGSSGSPFFDPEGLIIGQLHGGSASCSSNYTYNGRFSKSWDGSNSTKRLKDWLDPVDETPVTLEGMENPASLVMVFSGTVHTADEQGVEEVVISISGEIETETTTDINGFFYMEDIPTIGSYQLAASKKGNVKNGVSALDIVLLRKHLLGLEPFSEDYQWVAADVDQSGSVTAVDIVQIRKVLLGLQQEFSVPSWILTPSVVTVNNPKAPEETFEFTAVKAGDLDLSADPTQ